MPKILVVIVTYNALKWVKKCLNSVEKSSLPADVLVIDNGSTDGTLPLIRTDFPRTRIIETGENVGFGAANNRGLRIAHDERYDFVYLLNQDAGVFPETCGTLVRAFEEDGTTGSSGLRKNTGKPVGILSPVQMEAGRDRMDAQFLKHCGKALDSTSEEIVRIPFVMAAHWMVSRECLEAVGGFSPAFPHYGEDLDFIHRAAYKGFAAAVVRTASAVHDRADRPRPKEYRMKLKVITARTAVTNPDTKPLPSLIGQSVILALQGVRHLSIIPWKGIGELWKSYGRLLRFREDSLGKGAFLY